MFYYELSTDITEKMEDESGLYIHFVGTEEKIILLHSTEYDHATYKEHIKQAYKEAMKKAPDRLRRLASGKPLDVSFEVVAENMKMLFGYESLPITSSFRFEKERFYESEDDYHESVVLENILIEKKPEPIKQPLPSPWETTASSFGGYSTLPSTLTPPTESDEERRKARVEKLLKGYKEVCQTAEKSGEFESSPFDDYFDEQKTQRKKEKEHQQKLWDSYKETSNQEENASVSFDEEVEGTEKEDDVFESSPFESYFS